MASKCGTNWGAKLAATVADLRAKKEHGQAKLAADMLERLDGLLTKMDNDRDPLLMTGMILLAADVWRIADCESAVRSWASTHGLALRQGDWHSDRCEKSQIGGRDCHCPPPSTSPNWVLSFPLSS
jgi:hypothetical protein